MSDCFLDAETAGLVDISLGTDLYTANCTPIIWTWAVDDDDVRLEDMYEQQFEVSDDFRRVLTAPEYTLVAHHAAFDRGALHRGQRILTDIRRWRCTRAQAYSAALPGGLETVGAVVGLAEHERKLSDGKRLIQRFTIPNDYGQFARPSEYPDDWRLFCLYAVGDTATLRRVYRKLPQYNYRGESLALWHLDQRINGRGFALDRALAIAATSLLDRARCKHNGEVSAATGGAVTAATQRDRLLTYLCARGLGIENLRAGTVREALESDTISGPLRQLLELRLEASKSSGAKYGKGLRMAGADGRIRHTSIMGAAGTGRATHKGFQPGNMSRPVVTVRKPSGKLELQPVKAKYIDEVVIPAIRDGSALSLPEVYGGPNEACSLALRHCIIAATGNEFVVGDWSNIEGRILAWIAAESWKLDAFRAKDAGHGADLYKLLYARFFGKLIDTINDTERQAGKVVDLSMGFHGGVGAFVTMAAGYGIDLTVLPTLVLSNADEKMLAKAYKAWRRALLNDEDYELSKDVYMACDILKQLYRASSPSIDGVAYDIDRSIRCAIETPSTIYEVAKCRIWSTGNVLIIELPSKRRLLYWQPKLHNEKRVDPENGKESTSQTVSYMRARGKSWTRTKAWMGLFVENIVQAIANDILREAMLRIDRYSWATPVLRTFLESLHPDERSVIVLHVHDEIVSEVPRGTLPVEKYNELLEERPKWCTDLPLAAECWVGPTYGKREGKRYTRDISMAETV